MYKIADFYFDMTFQHHYSQRFSTPYLVESDVCDIKFLCGESDYSSVRKKGATNYFGCVEYMAYCRKLAEWLPLHNAFVLHSACFDVGGEGVVFAAHSGTGKTTHMLLWQKLLGDKMTIVNGDKPIVRFFEDEPNIPYAYGTPWNGKEHYGCNMRTPVKHICFIERSETNYVEKMQPSEIINSIFNQVYMPKDPIAVANTIQLINRFINSCSLWKIHCNMDISAAETAYNAIFKSSFNDE